MHLFPTGVCRKRSSREPGGIAGYLGLNNLIMFYDSNDIQLSTETNAVTAENTAMKYEAWGWNVMTINGNNPNEIRDAIRKAQKEKSKPSLIIGKTIMGKGAVDANGIPLSANVQRMVCHFRKQELLLKKQLTILAGILKILLPYSMM